MSKPWIVLLTLALAGVCMPLVASADDCFEPSGADACDVDCALCLCCSHAPPAMIHALVLGAAADDSSNLAATLDLRSPTPVPWEILHVPRARSPR